MRYFFWILSLICISQISAQTPLVFHAQGSVDLQSVYVGQAVIYTLQVVTSINELDFRVELPQFTGIGYSSQDIPPIVANETHDGQLVTIVTQQYLLYPLVTGELVIDSFQVIIEETPFNSARTLSTDAITINVLAIPNDQDDSFIDGIGQFEVVAEVSPLEIQAGDAFTLVIRIIGSGNLEQITRPLLTLRDSWRIFEDDSWIVQETLLTGEHGFSWIIIPDDIGEVTIESIPISYFNPVIGVFETRATSPIQLAIIGTLPVSSDPLVIAPIAAEERPLKALGESAIPTRPVREFWLLWLIAPTLSLLIRFTPSLGSTKQNKNLQNKLSQGKWQKALTSASKMPPQKGYLHIYEILRRWETARKKPLSEAQNIAIQRLLQEAQSGQYAPVTSEDLQQLVAETKHFIKQSEQK